MSNYIFFNTYRTANGGGKTWLRRCVTKTLICRGGFTNRLSKLEHGATDLKSSKFELKTMYYMSH